MSDPSVQTASGGPLRVLVLSAASAIHTQRWANAFAERGLDVHLVSEHPPIDGYSDAVTIHRMPHLRGLGYFVNGPRFRRLTRRIRPDVVNAHYATGYGLVARWTGPPPLVLNVWGSDVYDFPRKSPLHRLLLRQNLRRADFLVSTSEAMAAQTQTLCRESLSITIVPFGVDTSVFTPRRHPVDPAGEVVIGTVKALTPKYGVDTLVKAYARFRKDEPKSKTRLRIVGGGPQEAQLKRLVSSLELDREVEFVGAVPHKEVPDQLRRLDVYVALSRLDSESFGVAIIEASSCGLPVLVSDVDGLVEVVERDVTGAVVPREAVDQAALRLAQLVASPDTRNAWGSAGRKRVIEKYEWSSCVDKMLDVLHRADASNARR
jgi:L-malate glycosyltransferase